MSRADRAVERSVAGPTLADCIDPCSLERFVAERWQKDALLVTRRDPSYFAALIDLDEFDAIVSETGLRHPYFRLFKDGRPLPLAETTTARQLGPDRDNGLADLGALYDAYAGGATIVLQALERWWPTFRRLCREFELTFGFPTQAHAYLTPQSAQGAPIHYDTHDVFVLQVEGAKRWRVWEPVNALPMRMSEDRYEPDAVAAHARDRPPIIDVELCEGDSLYLPRGYIHDVRTGESRSLHVTISVMMDRWVDLANAVVSQRLSAVRESEAFRAAIPFGRAPFAAPPDAQMRATYERLVQAFVNGLDFEAGFELMRRKMANYAAPSFRGRLLDVERGRTLASEQVVSVRTDGIVSLSDAGDGAVTLAFGAVSATFERRYLPALRHVVSVETFRPADLPGGLDAGEQIACTRRLVEVGLCTLGDEWRA